ncbi:hypothetical protein JNUCC64_17025 [Streptomyces sp. JNUCC 64]
MIGASLALAALGLGSLLIQSAGSSGHTPDASPERTVSAEGARESFSEGDLRSRVTELLSSSTAVPFGTDSPSFGAAAGDAPPQPTAPLRGEDSVEASPDPQVPPCVRQGISRTERPLAAQEGTYAGKPAYLVVLPHASDAAQVSAYVVDATCVTRRSAGPGSVLLTHSYPRP